jgi:hypothetical protein
MIALPERTSEPVAPVGSTSVVINDTTAVYNFNATYPNLATAVGELVKLVSAGEGGKLNMAAVVDAIDRQQLYREVGCANFSEFFPTLLAQTESVGWKSAGSIKRYLAFFRTYIRELDIGPKRAIGAVSHLHILYRLANVDRKTQTLSEEEKAGKLEAEAFAQIAELVAFLVAAEPKALRDAIRGEGLSGEPLKEVLHTAVLSRARETYEEIMGTELTFPKGGWKVSDTQAIVDAVIGADEEEEKDTQAIVDAVIGADEEEEKDKVVRVWVGKLQTMDGTVYVERLSFRTSDGTEIEHFLVDSTYSSDMYKKLKGSDKDEIEGDEDE